MVIVSIIGGFFLLILKPNIKMNKGQNTYQQIEFKGVKEFVSLWEPESPTSGTFSQKLGPYSMCTKKIYFDNQVLIIREGQYTYSFVGSNKNRHAYLIKALISKGYQQVLSQEQIEQGVPQSFVYEN
jgi:hypothetical protein